MNYLAWKGGDGGGEPMSPTISAFLSPNASKGGDNQLRKIHISRMGIESIFVEDIYRMSEEG